MNSIKKFAALCILVSLAAACRDRDTAVAEHSISIENVTAPADVDISDLTDSVHYTVLETSDDCLIGNVRNIKGDQGFYFVNDEKQLYAFDETGRFVSSIGNRGRARNEYSYIDTFFIDRARRLVGVVCNYDLKINYYTYRGEFSHTVALEKEDANIKYVTVTPDGRLLAYYPFTNSINETTSQYKLLTENDGCMKSVSLMPSFPVSSGNMSYSAIRIPAAVYQGKCHAASVFSHDIRILENGDMNTVRCLDTANPVPDDRFFHDRAKKEILDLMQDIQQAGLSMGITAIEASDGYLFAAVDGNTIIWDGERAVSVRAIRNSDSDVLTIGGMLTGGWSDENIGYESAEWICAMRDKGSIKGGRLARIADSLEEYDNPVLFRYHFKKGLVDSILAQTKK